MLSEHTCKGWAYVYCFGSTLTHFQIPSGTHFLLTSNFLYTLLKVLGQHAVHADD